MDLQSIDQLNERFAIPGVAEVVAGSGGLPAVRVTLPGASAEIYLHGAQVTSWRPADSEEVIFLSAQSRFEAGKAIRGGFPSVFPGFGRRRMTPRLRSTGLRGLRHGRCRR